MLLLFQPRALALLLVLSFCIDFSLSAGAPWTLPFLDTPVGPDGPWNALLIGIDAPTQNMSMFPSLTKTSLLINETACLGQTAACPLPIPSLWDSGNHEAFAWMNGGTLDAANWDDTVSNPLRLRGQGLYVHETFRLFDGDRREMISVNDQVSTTSSDFTITYPGTAMYTMDIGLFSLYGGSPNQTYTTTNGSIVTFGLQLPSTYNQGFVPSNTYGLHLGSGTLDIPGSLVLGGYDRSRCLTDPITTQGSTLSLTDISLNVEDGGSAFIGLQNGSISGLQSSNSTSGSLTVMPNPGVPYLYLPQDTCDAIARYLPVTFDKSFGLYLWNTTDPAFEKIVSSPHVLSFTFTSTTSTSNNTIHVPFALLNLTLEQPLVSTSTPYFPCSPYTPEGGSTYHLGRAFLQAAFLAQNWQTNTTWLAQAPGPEYSSESTTILRETDTSLTSMPNAPAYLETWKGSLTTLSVTNSSTSGSTSDSDSGSSSGLSGGAIAGIVIGVLALLIILLAIALLLLRRRERAVRLDETKEYPLADQHASSSLHEASSNPVFEAPHSEMRKNGVPSKPVELGSPQPVSELAGSEVEDAAVRDCGH